MTALVEGLVEQGHLVTSVFYAKSNIKNKNYKEILVEDRYVGTDIVFTQGVSNLSIIITLFYGKLK